MRIVERTPVGVVESGHGFTVVDAAGVPLSTTAERPAGYALIDSRAATDASSFRGVGHRAADAPRGAARAGRQRHRPDAGRHRAAGWPDGTTIVWGSADQSALKADAPAEADGGEARSGQRYDVSSPNVGVVG